MTDNPNPNDYLLSDDDVSHLEGETMVTRWVRVDYIPLLLAQGNPKLHDLGAIWESIVRDGYVDKGKLDSNLTNKAGFKGALVYGNGRNEALHWGWTRHSNGQDDRKPASGVKYDDDGYWYIPVETGLDAKSESAALALLLDHNNLTVLGGDIDASFIPKLYDQPELAELVKKLGEAEYLPLSMDAQDINQLLEFVGDGDIDFDLENYDMDASVTGESGDDAAYLDEADAQESGIRMVQLYFNTENIEQFSDCIRALQGKYDANDVTDIVLEALQREADNA